MREQIAMLDGLGKMADPYVQDYSEFSAARDITPVPGGGQNYTGGSDWFPEAPYRLQQEGLAGLGSMGVDAWAGGSFTPEPGNGALYVGGSNWYPGAPTKVSSEGLAGSMTIERVPGWAGRSVSPVPGNGQNYTGGSDWDPFFPTKVSSEGLVGLGRLRGVAPSKLRAWVMCGVSRAMAIIGISRSAGDVGLVADQAIRLGFPRGTAMNARTVSALAAIYTARRVGATEKQAAAIGRRAASMCG